MCDRSKNPLLFSAVGSKVRNPQGFALPLAMILGMIMLTLATVSLLAAHSSRDSSQIRKDSGASAIVTDSAIARVLAELSKPENSVLLVRNYDPIYPKTNKIYLGADGITNSGDETGNAIDQWSNFDPSNQPCYQDKGQTAPDFQFTGTIGDRGSYELLAYRYDAALRIGYALVEGRHQNISTHVLITISIEPDFDNFPGIGLIRPDAPPAGVLGLRGRVILGEKGNVYFVPTSSANPNISGSAAPGALNRPDFLNAIWSSNSDGAFTDPVEGDLIACDAKINIPTGIKGTNFGVINTTQTLKGVGGAAKTLYQLERIELAGTEVLSIDTTGGPVQIDMIDPGVPFQALITLREQAKIVNIRTDGQPPQVGDVRIMIRSLTHPVVLYDQSCISQVFLYSLYDELRLFTDAPGCPSGQNTNFEGVVWAEAVLSSKNDVNNRAIGYLDSESPEYDSTLTEGATSGIAVPNDVSSLADVLPYTQIPILYRYGEVKGWQQVRL